MIFRLLIFSQLVLFRLCSIGPRKHPKRYDILTQVANTFQISPNESSAMMSKIFKKNKKSTNFIQTIDYWNVRLVDRGMPNDLFACESNVSVPVW